MLKRNLLSILVLSGAMLASVTSCKKNEIPDPDPVYQAEWHTSNLGSDALLKSIFFLDDTNGWIVGNNTLLTTTDGGKNWNGNSAKVSDQYNDVCFADIETGFIIGKSISPQGSLIRRTINGGETWIDKVIENSYGLNACVFTTKMNGWAVGEMGEIQRTTDGGSNWKQQEIDQQISLKSIYALDNNTAWVAGDQGSIYYTSNGGNSWVKGQTQTNDSFRDVFFVNSSKGWAVTAGNGSSNIYQTVDGGITWNSVEICENSYLNTIFFADHDNGFAAGQGSLIHQTNNGEDWSKTEVTSTEITDMFFISEDKGFAVGIDGYFAKYY